MERIKQLQAARDALRAEFDAAPENQGVDFYNWARNQHGMTSADVDELLAHEKAQNQTALFLHGSTRRADGTSDTFWTAAVESKESPLRWQEKGLSYTATGYGSRIPTRRMVRFSGKWRRVYCRIYSNSGTCYIGRLSATGENIIVREYA